MRIVLIVSILITVLAWTKPANKLENTRWAGVANVPVPMDVLIEFKKDSSFMFIENQVVETMSYTVMGDTLALTKLSGNSPCYSDKGLYRFKIENDVLKLETIEDACAERAAAWDINGYKKQ